VRYLLDTNIVSDLVRNPQGRASQRVALVGGDNVCTSVVVASELWYGAIKKDSPQLARQLKAVLDVMTILPLTSPADREYGRLRARLESLGRPIGGNDLFIAAHSVALGLTLVTDNVREFSRISELSCENWLR
jgi:tRNA(fMet)-specific endonuclease VapC